MTGSYAFKGSNAPELPSEQVKILTDELIKNAPVITDEYLEKSSSFNTMRNKGEKTDLVVRIAKNYHIRPIIENLVKNGAPVTPDYINELRVNNAALEQQWINDKNKPAGPLKPGNEPLYHAIVPVENPSWEFKGIKGQDGAELNFKFVIPEFDINIPVTSDDFITKRTYGLLGWLDITHQHIDRARALKLYMETVGIPVNNVSTIDSGSYEQWFANNHFIKGEICMGEGHPVIGPYVLIAGRDFRQLDAVLSYFGHCDPLS
jgi:hypothetical protein